MSMVYSTGRFPGWAAIGLCLWLQGCAAAVVGGAAAGGRTPNRDPAR